jgi:hypothetical protein
VYELVNKGLSGGKMGVNIDFINEAKKAFSKIPLSEIEINPALKSIKVGGGSIELEVYKTDKIEKIVFCTINIFDSGVIEATALAWPDEQYNFPVLWCNLTIVPSVMNVPVFDFIPLEDIVIHPEYADQYLDNLCELRSKALDVFGDTVIDKAVDLPSKTVYSLSPFNLVAMVSDEGILRVPEVAIEYINAYTEMIHRAVLVSNEKEQESCINRKRATRELMKANDPGYPFMIDVFGEEATRKVFDLVF